MKEPVIGISISQRLSNEFNVGERRLKISDDRCRDALPSPGLLLPQSRPARSATSLF